MTDEEDKTEQISKLARLHQEHQVTDEEDKTEQISKLAAEEERYKEATERKFQEINNLGIPVPPMVPDIIQAIFMEEFLNRMLGKVGESVSRHEFELAVSKRVHDEIADVMWAQRMQAVEAIQSLKAREKLGVLPNQGAEQRMGPIPKDMLTPENRAKLGLD